jgi:hypothetical protein
MYSTLPSFVLGFHGCDKSVAEKVLSGKTHLTASHNDYDWLGNGIYFWENNPRRALDFAVEFQSRQGKPIINEPYALGAIIDLGHCLNLLDSEFLGVVKRGYILLSRSFKTINKPMPKNTHALRRLDCAVIESVHAYTKDKNNNEKQYDTVRAVFTEGKALYSEAGFQEKNHIQICVVNPNCIKGYFRPLKPKKEYPIP